MKSYPSIPSSKKVSDKHAHVFVKYDGSNIRFEWSPKKGWYKFGTRNRTFDSSNKVYGSVIDLFKTKYSDDLEVIIRNQYKGKNVIVFAEWFGSQSIAGRHNQDDPKNLVLFDINIHKQGIISPEEFLDNFGHLEIAEYLGKEYIDSSFVESVRNGEFDCNSKLSIKNKVPEGVICKGGKGHDLWMCKIKTQSYLDLLKQVYGDDWTKYWE